MLVFFVAAGIGGLWPDRVDPPGHYTHRQEGHNWRKYAEYKKRFLFLLGINFAWFIVLRIIGYNDMISLTNPNLIWIFYITLVPVCAFSFYLGYLVHLRLDSKTLMGLPGSEYRNENRLGNLNFPLKILILSLLVYGFIFILGLNGMQIDNMVFGITSAIDIIFLWLPAYFIYYQKRIGLYLSIIGAMVVVFSSTIGTILVYGHLVPINAFFNSFLEAVPLILIIGYNYLKYKSKLEPMQWGFSIYRKRRQNKKSQDDRRRHGNRDEIRWYKRRHHDGKINHEEYQGASSKTEQQIPLTDEELKLEGKKK